jgi:hypothetical protein
MNTTPPPHLPQQPGYPYPQQQPYPGQPQPARITIHYGFALLAFFSLLGTVIPTIVMFASSGSADDGTRAGHEMAGIGGGMAIMWLMWGGMWTLIWAAFAINHTLKERRKG